MALIYVKRQYYQDKIVAYFKKNGGIVRYKLYAIEKRYLNSRYRVKDNYPLADSNMLNKQIDELEKTVDDSISSILHDDSSARITNSSIKELLSKKVDETNEQLQSNIILRDFARFIEDYTKKKSIEDKERGIERKLHPTCKDYISSLNALDDFQYDRGEIIYLADINEDFLEQFVDYLADERCTTSSHKYKTKGALQNSTLNKRLDCLSTFIRTYYKNEDVAKMVTAAKQDTERTDVIRLTKEELVTFAEMELDNESEQTIRDYFVFLCLTGLRFTDFTNINESNFEKRGRYFYLNLFTQKTIKRAEIRLTSRAMEIARSYNFKFNEYSNQLFNRLLKDIFRKYDLFSDTTYKVRFVKKRIEKIPIPRRERLSAHSARRTFISILVENNVPIARIMSMTGHTKESTLKIYVDKFSPKAAEAVVPLEF